MKKPALALSIWSALALGLGYKLVKNVRLRQGRRSEESRIADRASQRFMMYVALPARSIAGAVDWLMHRQTKIETTSGPKESVMHLLMMLESGMSVLAGLFLEPNGGMFAIMTGGMMLHQATVVYDVEYTVSRRKIPAFEQHTHTFMETLPFDILAVFAALHPEAFQSMLGLGREKPDFSLRLRKPRIPIPNIAAVVSAITIVSALPHVEELWRCLRAKKQGLTGTETPECARKLYAA